MDQVLLTIFLFYHNDFDCITHFCILLPDSFSDHCGIEVNMAKKYRSQNKRKAQNDVTNEETIIQWDETKSMILTHYYLQK